MFRSKDKDAGKGCDNVLEMDLNQLRNCEAHDNNYKYNWGHTTSFAPSYTCFGVPVTKGLGCNGYTPEYIFAKHHGYLKQGALGLVIDTEALEAHFDNSGKAK